VFPELSTVSSFIRALYTIHYTGIFCIYEYTSFIKHKREHRLMVFENRVLRRIFGLKKGGSGRRLEKTAK
jgi:hypothetical protein